MTTTTLPEVQIPSEAVSGGKDLSQAARDLLEGLSLLPKPEDAKNADGLRAAFLGPPDSVAVIEAGATAATKYWAAGLGVTVVAAWGRVFVWWGGQPDGLRAALVGAAALVTAAVALAIGYLFASDVRGRAAATVATVQARAQVATKMIEAVQSLYEKPTAASALQFDPLPVPLIVTNTLEPRGNEEGWLAIAIERESDGVLKYVIVKEESKQTVEVSKLRFVR